MRSGPRRRAASGGPRREQRTGSVPGVGIDVIRLLAKSLGIADERRQRGPQLVAGIGDEVDAHLLGRAGFAAVEKRISEVPSASDHAAHQPVAPRTPQAGQLNTFGLIGSLLKRGERAGVADDLVECSPGLVPSRIARGSFAAITRPRRGSMQLRSTLEQGRESTSVRHRRPISQRAPRASIASQPRIRAPRMAGNYQTFAALHVPGDPVVLYNIWDVGSALAVVAPAPRRSQPEAIRSPTPMAGRRAAGAARFALANARRIVEAVELPLTVDFESAYSTDPQRRENVARLKATGAVGCNFEDQVIGGEGLHPLDGQVKRIAAIRSGGAISTSTPAPTLPQDQTYDDALVDQVVERGKAFADAGASGFFVPRLADPSRSSASSARCRCRSTSSLSPARRTRKPGPTPASRGSATGRSRTGR